MLKQALICLAFLLIMSSVNVLSQGKEFISVEGPSLKARVEAAVQKAGSVSPRRPFWTGYAFPVRPGISVDAEIPLKGARRIIRGVNVRIDPAAHSPNVGIFLLHDPARNSITRFEIYNLDRDHDYGGHAVYWLGRANAEESLEHLAELERPGPDGDLLEHLPLAMAIHDGPQVEVALKERVQSSRIEKVRAGSVMWLGRVVPGQEAFLIDVARNEQEAGEVRSHAIWGLAHEKNRVALPVMQELYQALSRAELREHVVAAIAENMNQDEAIDFVIKVANEDHHEDVRKKATFWLGQLAVERSFKSLSKAERAEVAQPLRERQRFESIKQMPDEDAVPVLIDIAKAHPVAEVRKEAFQHLSEIGNKQVLEFFMQHLSR